MIAIKTDDYSKDDPIWVDAYSVSVIGQITSNKGKHDSEQRPFAFTIVVQGIELTLTFANEILADEAKNAILNKGK